MTHTEQNKQNGMSMMQFIMIEKTPTITCKGRGIREQLKPKRLHSITSAVHSINNQELLENESIGEVDESAKSNH